MQTDPPKALVPARPPRRSFASLRAIAALMLREMSTTYGRTPGGYIWAIAEPVAAVTFLSLIFALFFGAPPIGQSFPMFYATGMLPFMVFNDVHNRVSQSLMYSKQLLAYPTVTFLDAMIARLVLNILTQLLVAYLFFGAIIFFFEGQVRLDLAMIALGYGLAAFLGFGIGALNAYIYMRIAVWQQLWSVMTRPLFIVSGVLMLYDTIPSPYREWMGWNPLVHVIGLVRSGFYETYDDYYLAPFYVMLVAMVTLALGLALLRRHYRDLFETV